MNDFIDEIFRIKTDDDFEKCALKIFRFQVENINVYKNYVNYLGININKIKSISDIPFLPIEFFKTHQIVYNPNGEKILTVFKSSGTTGMVSSCHLVKDISIYEKSFVSGFRQFYGDEKDYCILALLPNYLEKGDSSLVYMVNRLIKNSCNAASGFYLYDYKKLANTIASRESLGEKIFLIGVTFALWEFAEQQPVHLKNTIVMETGGMKGRKKEIVRDELHQILKSKLDVSVIHAEYGMTELLSQAYSQGNNNFKTPAWMKILVRNFNDPFLINPVGVSGGINVIDLANIYSCAFIETKDIGKLNSDGTFEVLGRFDNSDIRGCNLLVS